MAKICNWLKFASVFLFIVSTFYQHEMKLEWNHCWKLDLFSDYWIHNWRWPPAADWNCVEKLNEPIWLCFYVKWVALPLCVSMCDYPSLSLYWTMFLCVCASTSNRAKIEYLVFIFRLENPRQMSKFLVKRHMQTYNPSRWFLKKPINSYEGYLLDCNRLWLRLWECEQAVANGIMIHWFEMQPVVRSTIRVVLCADIKRTMRTRENRLHWCRQH